MACRKPLAAITCATALALALVPAASAAPGDLTVSVAKLTIPALIVPGKPVAFGVRYTVRGPLKRRANASVELQMTSRRNRYRIDSTPSLVRPAIWTWSVRDTAPQLPGGSYDVVATVTLTRDGKVISTTQQTATVTVSVR